MCLAFTQSMMTLGYTNFVQQALLKCKHILVKRKLKILYKDKKSLIPYLAKFEEAVKGETLTKVTYDSAVPS